MRIAPPVRWLVPALALALGCGPARSGGGFPSSCTPAATQPCMCDDTAAGTQVCGADSTWGACLCGDASADAATDDSFTPFDTGPRPDVVFPDVPVTQDLGVPPVDVGGPGPGAFGAPCTRLSDCASGVCTPSGRCSRACSGGTDCTSIAGWNCSTLAGLGPVCNCTPRGAETCNGLDDDCNGLVDEGTSMCGGRCVDLSRDPANCGSCGTVCPTGTCSGGACACGSATPTRCGGACVNTLSDPMNCGSCGTVCPSGACASGRCQGSSPVCPSTCAGNADCNPCRSPSDPSTVNYCCVSGMCVFRNMTCTEVDAGLPDVPSDTPSDTSVDVPSDAGTGLDVGDLDALFDALG